MPLPEPIYNPKPNLGGTNAALGAKLSDTNFQGKAITSAASVIPAIPRDPIETLIKGLTTATALLQVGTYKILWGGLRQNNNDSLGGQALNFLQSGVFNILDTINSLDLCNILSFITTVTNGKPAPRSTNPTPAQKALYFVQDQAKLTQDTIDRYLALPNQLVKSYVGTEPQVITQQQAINDYGLPANQTLVQGSDVQKFNVYNLLQNLKDLLSTLTPNTPNSLFTAEDSILLSEVAGLGGAQNFIDDFIGYIEQYSDYRNIPNDDLQKLLKKINDVRSVCVTIQVLDFRSGLALAANFLGIDIRAQIQKLSNLIDPTRLLPAIKQISQQIDSFARSARRLYNIISQLQFVIKVALLLIKIFKFVQAFFLGNPLPNLFTWSGLQEAFSTAKAAANNKSNQVIKRLEQVNGLLSVVLNFARYLIANADELLIRLRTLILQLEACESTKDSAVLEDLRASAANLQQVREQLATYVANHDGKTNPNSALFGKYDIRVVDEEVTDLAIPNKRRRGIALDQSGAIVAQSDLTFATNTSIIIEEVKVKLISLGLVASSYSSLNASDLSVIATSLSYLENDTVISEDFSFDDLLTENIDPPDGSDENQGLGLNAFINNLKGGRKLRKRVRAAMENASTKFQNQLAQDKVDGATILNTSNIASNVGTGDEPVTGSVDQVQQKALKK